MQKEQQFFPDRAPRPSQMLNPEATWRVITNVIPSDLMDTLVRCYVSLATQQFRVPDNHANLKRCTATALNKPSLMAVPPCPQLPQGETCSRKLSRV